MLRASLLLLSLISATPLVSEAQNEPSIENYPRPMLLRPAWKSLNGSWEFTSNQDATKPPTKWAERVQIPQIESRSITGVNVHWFRLQLPTPKPTGGNRAMIRFESISGEALVFVNGSPITTSSGSRTTLSLDITDLVSETPTQEITISCRPSENSNTVGIPGTVWLETIPRTHIDKLTISPNPDTAEVTVFARIWGQANFRTLEVQALDGEKKIAEGTAFYHYKKGGYETTLKIPDPKNWSPDSPKLYGLRIRMANEDGTTHDDITSYFALRKPTISGTPKKFALNTKPLFLTGYTENKTHHLQTDEEIRAELQSAKTDGYNLIQRTEGIADKRFYHWADRLGVIIWHAAPTDKEQLERLGASCANHPSVVIWPSGIPNLEKNRTKLFTAGKKNADLIAVEGADAKIPADNQPSIAIIDRPITAEKKARLSGVVFSKKPKK